MLATEMRSVERLRLYIGQRCLPSAFRITLFTVGVLPGAASCRPTNTSARLATRQPRVKNRALIAMVHALLVPSFTIPTCHRKVEHVISHRLPPLQNPRVKVRDRNGCAALSYTACCNGEYENMY